MSSTRMAVVTAAGARKGLAAAGAAAAAAGAAAGGAAVEPAESRAAPAVHEGVGEAITLNAGQDVSTLAPLTHDNLKMAANAMIESGELLQSFSEDGTMWVDVAKEILEEATELAAREDMQRIIMESAERRRNRALTIRLLEAQQAPPATTEAGIESMYSFVEEGGPAAASCSAVSVASSCSNHELSAGWSTPSLSDVLAAENEALRLENEELRQANRALGGQADAACRLQRAARARLGRTRWYERGSVVRELRKPALAPPPELSPVVRVVVDVAAAAVARSGQQPASKDPGGVEPDPPPRPASKDLPTVRVRLCVGLSGPEASSTPADASCSPGVPSPPRAPSSTSSTTSSYPRAVPPSFSSGSSSYEGLVVALSIVVGVLAVVMMRDPRAASKAAAGAAATVKAMCAVLRG